MFKKKTRVALLFSLASAVIAGCNAGSIESRTTPTAPELRTADSTTKVVVQVPDYNVLSGDWQRADGEYTISIKNILADGVVSAEYYNPNPINVGKSFWKSDGNNLYLLVELRDANYPGSTYKLQYFPEDDKLAGNYFQAVEGNNYEVMFDRKK